MPQVPLRSKAIPSRNANPAVAAALERGNELLDEARVIPYKVIGEHSLNLHIFDPGVGNNSRVEDAAAIAFFFGGKWDQSLIGQFTTHCMHFASRGVVSMVAEYRVSSLHGTGPLEAMADARTAFRWIRQSAEYLGIDPEKIIGAGASSGAHLVAACALIDDESFDDEADDRSVSCAPNAMVLFSPVIEIASGGFGFECFPDKKTAKAASPLTHVRKGLPPAIIFQGLTDRVVSHDSVARFSKLYKKKKNICEFIGYKGEGHGFSNFNVNFRHYESTLISADHFLVEQGFLAPNPDADDIPRLSTYIG